MNSGIERVDLASQRSRSLAAPGTRVLCSGDRWGGIRVQHVHSPAAEWREYYVRHNVISVLVGNGCLAETWLPGKPLTTWRLPPNSVFVLPAWMPVKHTNFASTEGIQVEIMPETLAATRGAWGKPVELRPAFGVEDPFVFQLLMALRGELRSQDPAGRLYAETLGSALAVHLSRRYGSSGHLDENHRGGLAPHSLRRVKEYVDAHLGLDLRLAELASLVQMNVDSFIRAFRQSVGVPPHRYILMQRIDRARALLRARDSSIAEIAVRCGFGSQSSFTRAFHRLTGLTPREVRRSL